MMNKKANNFLLKNSLLVLAFLMLNMTGIAQTIEGKWKTIDDNTGKPRSVVEIFKKDNKFYGKIVKLFRAPDEDQDPICDECKGDLKNEKIIGMQIINDLEFDAGNNEYDDGTILDPENGKVYDCKIWLDGENLKLRGYVMFFYRTQTWLPYEG